VPAVTQRIHKLRQQQDDVPEQLELGLTEDWKPVEPEPQKSECLYVTFEPEFYHALREHVATQIKESNTPYEWALSAGLGSLLTTAVFALFIL
jgi:hypothetical protein